MKVFLWGSRAARLRAVRLLFVAVGLSIVVLAGCRREAPSSFDRNLPPETYISWAPAESTLSYYLVHLYWNGEDPDGVVDHYQFAVTDSNKTPGEDTPEFSGYFRTENTDSTFLFTADNPQVLGHRFYVRSVDNEGKQDPTPAWTYFVAHDFNFPNVVWNRAMGFWTTSTGEDASVHITSNNRFTPKDTIGVGGRVEYTWTGFDVDPGGSVVGFEFRESTSLGFRGGSAADTTFTKQYAQTFSGKDALHVKAIDDAGAKTLPDSIRAVVINFNPVTVISDPLQPENPTPKRVFIDDNGVVRPSGTILADGFRGISFAFTGFDDPRDLRASGNPDDPAITGFAWRRLENGGGQAYREITDWVPYPQLNLFNRGGGAGSQGLYTADWSFLIRSRDTYGRWGQPDTLVVRVNYPPYMLYVDYVDAGGVERPLWTGANGDPVTVTIPFNGGNPPPLHLRYRASDEHSVDNPDPMEISQVVEDENGAIISYRVRINGSSGGFETAPPDELGESFLAVTTDPNQGSMVREGLNNITVEARDDGTGDPRQNGIAFTFNVVFSGNSSPRVNPE